MRKYRLSNAKQIALLARSKYKKVDKTLFIRSLDNGLDYARLVISVRKKDYPRAVDRNTIKRKIREFFRKKARDLEGKDMLVIVRLMKKPFNYRLVDESMNKFLGA